MRVIQQNLQKQTRHIFQNGGVRARRVGPGSAFGLYKVASCNQYWHVISLFCLHRIASC